MGLAERIKKEVSALTVEDELFHGLRVGRAPVLTQVLEDCLLGLGLSSSRFSRDNDGLALLATSHVTVGLVS